MHENFLRTFPAKINCSLQKSFNLKRMISIKNPNRIAPLKCILIEMQIIVQDPELNKFHSMLPRARILKLFKEMRANFHR